MYTVKDLLKDLENVPADTEILPIEDYMVNGRNLFLLKNPFEDDQDWMLATEFTENDKEDYLEDDYDECGFDPYEGCYTDDC